MMNNKIYSIVAIAIVGLLIWFGYANRGSSNILTTTQLDTGSHSLSLSYPKSWGSIKLNPNEENFLPNDFLDTRGFNFSNYSDMPHSAPSDLIIQDYVAKFVDDKANPADPWWFNKTAAQKNAIIKPLLTIYKQRSVAGIPLINYGDEATKNPNQTLGGWWWGNESAFQHRMNATYLENSAGDLRGVGYFSNSAQEEVFTPVYSIILINPDKRVVIEGNFRASNLSELSKWIPNASNTSDVDELAQLTHQGEAYLNDPVNYGTQLKNFVGDIHALVSSMALIK